MSEDEPKAAPAVEPTSAIEAAAEAGLVSSTTADLPGEEMPAGPATPPGPVNKLHEWAAALAIMALLTAILFGFLFFLRGTSI